MLQSHANHGKVPRYIAADVKSFRDALYSYLKDEVVKIIKTDGTWSVGSILNQDVSKEMLNNILWWLFNDDPEKSLLELEQLNNPQHICGHVFKPGEPTYSCRDCATDPTCVFCQRCFRMSEHKKHRYKVDTDDGGGMCDCGDPEAFLANYRCSSHEKQYLKSKNKIKDSVSRLPDVVRERAPHFFEVLLMYAADLLTVERSVVSELKESLRPSTTEDCYVTMLFNDESHTFDYVIDVLKKALKCDENVGSDFATIIDREGRSAVCIGDEKACEDVKKRVSTPPTPFFHFRTTEPLKALIIHVSVVAHQEMALLILPWLSRIVQQSEGLRKIFCDVAMKELIPVVPSESSSGSGMTSVVEQFIRCDHELWKTARNLYQQLLMNSLLLDTETKKNLSVLFTRLYGVIQEGFLKGDHDHGQSVSSLAVQLYTVPTISRHLIVHEDVLRGILLFIANCCCDAANVNPDNWCQLLRLNPRRMRNNFRRMQYCFYDLKYILTNLPDQWTDELRVKFVQGIQMFLRIFMAMQGMDSITRKSDRHIEHEPEWETGITLVMRFNPIIHHILQWCRTDVNLLFTVLKHCMMALDHMKNPESEKLGSTTYKGKTYNCIDYDITKQQVSIQFPVTRLAAAILVELARCGVTWQDIEENDQVASEFSSPATHMSRLLECPLRCLCLSAQVNSGIWRRNGLSLVNQIFYYRDYRCRKEAFERDIQMLQCCAARMDPDHFIALILHKIKLNPEPREFAEYHVSIMGEFFRLLICVCGERYIPGVGEVTREEQTRRQTIHILAAEAKPHSKIAKQLPDVVTEKPAWEDILHQVADFKESKNINASGKYELKSECFSEFCPYSYHYTSPTDETKAHNEVARRKTALQLSTIFVPPRLPPFTSLFSNVPFLLCSDFFVHGMSTFLQQLTADRQDLWSDKLVETALYLIGMAIVETEQQTEMDPNTTFNFVRKAVSGCESSILFLMKQLQVTDSLSIHRETLRWLVAKIEKLSNHRPGTSSSVDPTELNKHDERTKESENMKNVRKRKAQELRDKLLGQMKEMQQSFLSQNPDMMTEMSTGSSMEMSQEIPMSQDEFSPVCTELSWQLQVTKGSEPSYVCILCQEETPPSEGSIVMSALVQRSTVLTRGPCEPQETEDKAPLFMDLSFPNAVHASTCSHTMHFECFKQFRDSVASTEARRRQHRFSRKAFNVNNNEFLCPLCSRLSNTVIPVIPHTLVAKQRGIITEDGEEEIPSTSVDAGPPTMKAWLKAIEEILTPMKHEKQEIILKFHVDVTDLYEKEEVESDARPDVYDNARPRGDNVKKITEPQATVSKIEVLPEGLKAALDDFVHMAQSIGFDGEISEAHRPLTVWISTATTIMSIEMVSRLDNTPILGKSPIRLSSALDGVVRASVALSATSSEEQLSELRKYARSLLSSLIGLDVTERSHHGLLRTNIFATFVSTWFSSVILRKSKQMKDHPIIQHVVEFERHLLFLCTLAQIVQIFLFLDVEHFKDETTGENVFDSSTESNGLHQACNQFRQYANFPPLPAKVTEGELFKVVSASLQPFIRCCALFLHHVTGVPAPTKLETVDHQGALLSYLGLPKHLNEFFDVGGELSLDPLIRKWCEHPDVKSRATSLPSHLMYPTVSDVPDVIPFPHDYSDLIGAVSAFKCPKFASEDSLCPTMCVVCGVVLCSQSYCCQQPLPGTGQQVGACTHHAHSCGAGAGMFLRVRESTIVLLHGVYRGCFIHAPYLDRYGETDKGFSRGNPLYLNKARLLELRKLWLSHGIAERVSHDVESRHVGHILDWTHL